MAECICPDFLQRIAILRADHSDVDWAAIMEANRLFRKTHDVNPPEPATDDPE